MASLILTHPEDMTNSISKVTIPLENWRAFGIYKKSELFLIVSDLSCYRIQKLSLKKFLEVVKLGFDLPVKGYYECESLACEKCFGTGITDWVSKIVGNHHFANRTTFVIDKKFPMYSLNIPTKNNQDFTLHFNRTKIEEPLEHCPVCGGTGLMIFADELDYTPIDKIPTGKF